MDNATADASLRGGPAPRGFARGIGRTAGRSSRSGAACLLSLLPLPPPASYPAQAAAPPRTAPRVSPHAAVSATIGGGSTPQGMDIDPATNTLYIANNDNTVSVINEVTNTISATISAGLAPGTVAIDQATNTLYVANQGSNTVSVNNGATNSVSATLGVGSQPIDVAVNAATDTVYVTNFSSNSVSVINGASNTVSATVSVGRLPNGVAVDEATDTVYVANDGDNTVSVINGATNSVSATVSLASGSGPGSVAVDDVTHMVYVADSGTNKVSVINGAASPPVVTTLVGVGNSPYGVAVDSLTDTIYVANQSDGTVSVINGAANTVSATFHVGNGPFDVDVDTAANTIYVANNADSTVSVISGATNTVIATIPVGTNPESVAVDQATGMVYTANLTARSVSVIAGLAPPGAPAIENLTAGDGSITLHWRAPASDGGSPITGYYVTPTPPTVQPVFVGGNDLTATVAGLSNGTAYTFTVTAVNAIGAGQPSSRSGPVMPQGPSSAGASHFSVSPPSVAAGGNPPATATVRVTLLDDNGNPESGKTVSISQGNGHSTIGAASGPSDANGVVSFAVSDATAEVVTFTATDVTDQVHLSQTVSVAFTAACSGCKVAVSPSGERASPGSGSIVAAIVVPAAGMPVAGLGRWQLGLHYDATLVTPTACTSFDSACDFTSTPGEVAVSGTASPALAAGSAHTLATVTFSLSAPTGTTSTMNTSADLFVDGAGVPQAATTQGLLIVVGKQGDVNLDKSVTATDALCVLRDVARLGATAACPQAPANQVMADVNADGSVTATDALCVLREVAQLGQTAACPQLPTASHAQSRHAPAPAAPSRSADGVRLTLTPSAVGIQKGKPAAVTLTAEAGSVHLGAWTIDIAYDAQAVRVVSCTPLDGSVCNASYAAGVVRLSGVSVGGLTGTQPLATFSFVGVGHRRAESALTFTPVTLADASGAASSTAP